ncbi:MAG: hypothetical protein ACRDBY_08700, partial [Cetobacterium sp.]
MADINRVMSLWNIPALAKEQLEKTQDTYKTKHGMFAQVPIICKGVKCPFYSTCVVDAQFRIENTRCLNEISIITSRFEELCKHFSIEMDGEYIKPQDVVDASMIRDIVDIEIQTLRAESKIA